MRTSAHERLLRRLQTKGGLRGGRRYVQGPGGSHLLREPLLGQTIRRQGRAGRISSSEEETQICSDSGIEDVLGKDLPRKHLPARRGEVERMYRGITKARALLGYSPQIFLKKGLQTTYRW